MVVVKDWLGPLKVKKPFLFALEFPCKRRRKSKGLADVATTARINNRATSAAFILFDVQVKGK